MVDPALVARTLAEGRAAWPEVTLDEQALAEHLARLATGERSLESARGAEIYLACACLAGDPTAVRAVEDAMRDAARRAAAELGAESWLADEILGALRARMLLPGADEGPPRLATFAGQSSIGRWLGVAAARLGLNLLRSRRREQSFRVSAIDAAIGPDDDAELDAIRERYREDFAAAVREAFRAIEAAGERNLLRLYYYDHVGLDALGAMYGVSASTISRRLAALRARVREDTRRRLADRLHGRESEIASLVRLLGEDLDITLSRILAPAPATV